MSSETAPLSVDVVVRQPDVAVVSIGGDLDMDTATELHYQLANQIAHGRRNLVLDLSAVPFMDSSGLNIILRTLQEARRIEGSVQVVAPTPAVRRILELTGVALAMPIRDTVDAAVLGVAEAVEAASRGALEDGEAVIGGSES
ncbi:STAS domain-containing protein [Streptantibioticus rubrisoli]|uniref:Anti-sigma factor antagonist n=1 Tax=Streptantibioticus rubrisoli TaxID=1387313 RepID=A0ABT1P6T7_9ACTN|nr:STAS domain-containing protein [Streptantibioticus rubrisoli]MCQ4041079.1 STAS domain-containing protein [Streptantibioticus rubrisoli]